MGDAERILLLDAFDSNWVSPLGPHVDAFEREVADYVGMGHGAATSSGTGALHLALIMAGVGPGDRVVCPSLTFVASANPIVYCGADPVFIDCDLTSWNIDPALLEEELETSSRSGKLPKVVITVDLYGQSADYNRIVPLCEKYGVVLIEDAAEALGATCGARKAGAFGAMSILSFNGNKIITTGGGGMLLSNDVEKVARARFLATQARDPEPHYQHSSVGFNYRLSNLLAAVGRGQMLVLSGRIEARRRIFDLYVEHLDGMEGISFMPEAAYGRTNRWLTCIQVDPEEFGADRKEILLALGIANIESRPLWKPMHLQPLFANCEVRGGDVSTRLFERGLCLPSGSNLKGGDLERTVDIIKRCRKPSRARA
jgi:pyridoxal phosphate-dependent aminotransferase EpsN